jgi:hypothetical protein
VALADFAVILDATIVNISGSGRSGRHVGWQCRPRSCRAQIVAPVAAV